MQRLTLDPPCPYALAPGPLCILLCGCGGTGSHIAQSLARIAVHVRDSGGPSLQIVLIDGDRVENRNVGRQLFSPAEVGLNKAQALAARFSMALGLKIMAIPEMATRELLESILGQSGPITGIVVGAVDSAAGRHAMHDLLALPQWKVWLDCGNHDRSGQVVCGTAVADQQLKGAFTLPGLCTGLPTASLIYPELLQPEPVLEGLDCAAAMTANLQSLMVNQQMAAIAAEYLYQLIVERRITTFQTVCDLRSLAMRSTPITAANVAQATGIAEEWLRGTGKRARRRKKAA